MNDTVFIASKNEKGSWHVIAALKKEKESYIFYYTKGVEKFNKFSPFAGMDNLFMEYKSTDLFPFFKNRMISEKRPEYQDLIEWLGLDKKPDPIKLLSLTGERETDSFEFFGRFPNNRNNDFTYNFFAHGLKYFISNSEQRLSKLKAGETLKLVLDVQNDFDKNAVAIRSEEPSALLAYCPRYISGYISDLLKSNSQSVIAKVKKFNIDAPSKYTLLCELEVTCQSVCVEADVNDEYSQLKEGCY